jgi:hypothetical protein
MNHFSSLKSWQYIVACTILLISGVTAVPAQVKAGPNRPAAVPEGYVITPMGYFHQSCVKQLSEGDILRKDEMAIEHKDGSFDSIPACAFPHYTAAGEKVSLDGEPDQTPAIDHEWIVAADVKTGDSYGELRANWIVPHAPTHTSGQTIYFFPGLEDYRHVKTILQPVLGWNSDFKNAWGLASWNCCTEGTVFESKPIHTETGHNIYGAMGHTCKPGTLSCGSWDVLTEDYTTQKSTQLIHTSSQGQTFNWAFAGALEVYNVSRCSDYPSNGSIEFFKLGLWDDKFEVVPHDWIVTKLWKGAVQCGYGGSPQPDDVTLTY